MPMFNMPMVNMPMFNMPMDNMPMDNAPMRQWSVRFVPPGSLTLLSMLYPLLITSFDGM
ncbi:hypothetical protein ACPS0T_08160 [Yersinia pseudotuberculosis]|uniref:hypothetical protein n=1 Tax=Yersinia pseudotuberculosis TaxID=633 RepID=UPI00402B1C69